MSEHGTPERRRQGCTCPACWEAMRLYRQQFVRYGKPFTTQSHHARRHLLELQSCGISDHSVHELCGIGESTARDIRNGTQRRCRRATEEAILGISLDDLAPGQRRMPKAAAVALVERIVAHGVERQEIAARLGYARPDLGFMATRRNHLAPRTWARLQIVARLLVREGRVPADVLDC